LRGACRGDQADAIERAFVMSPWPASRPSIEMSSSRASQWMPRELSSKPARCSGVAAKRRGNQANGTPTTRPSSRSTHRLSSSKRTALAEVVIPSPFDQLTVVRRYGHQLAQGCGVEAIACSNADLWHQPKLRFMTTRPYVDMNRLARAALVRIEEKPEAFVAKNHGHARILGKPWLVRAMGSDADHAPDRGWRLGGAVWWRQPLWGWPWCN